MVYYLYIINCVGTDYYKIGVSDRPKSRVVTLQTGCPYCLELVKKYAFKTKLEAYAAEAVTHRVLNDHLVHGEWFKLKYFKLIRWEHITKGNRQQKEYAYRARLLSQQ
ncbi:hypothetical protein LCGC14_1411960 [marine sediment metagenome]|uniref:Bacteriophage T5 Orf172 DNA-binding domain-containing protein n=1 Tax=marine sediment metagenome TaxID=412755 RepID=A0A0F9JUD4_9ZZZZ|nr:hypothetical protein [Pricia sp.]